MSEPTKQRPRTPNDQRSDVKNPNNRDHKDARDNRANQKNPNHNPPVRDGGPDRKSR